MTLDELPGLIAAIIRDEVRRALNAEPPIVDEYMSTADAARLAKVAPATIRRWIKGGDLTKHAAGSRFRVSRRELELLLRRGAANDESPEALADKVFG